MSVRLLDGECILPGAAVEIGPRGPKGDPGGGGGPGGGIAEVVEDTTPQLGGDLDLNGNEIVGLVPGTDVAALVSGVVPDTQLPAGLARDTEVTAAIAAASSSYATAAQGTTADQALKPANNLSDVASVPTSQANLGLVPGTDVAALVAGTVPDAQLPAGLTRDTELTAAISAAINALLDGAPGALDTLNELAASIGDDADFAGTITAALAGKQPLATVLTNTTAAFTTAQESKLSGIATAATANATDAALRDRATHTGVQGVASISPVATARILGRTTAGSGAAEELTATQATTLINAFTSALKGLVPASGGGTANFLRADGTFAAPTAAAANDNSGQVMSVGRRWYWHYTGGANAITYTTAAGLVAWRAFNGSTLDKLDIRVTTGVASSTMKIGLYNVNSTTLVPTTLVASTSVDCSTSGIKALTGLGWAVVPGQHYMVAFLAVNSPTLYAVEYGSSGIVTPFNISGRRQAGISDNLARFEAWRYTPAVAGVLDASPTWTSSHSNIHAVNHSLELA